MRCSKEDENYVISLDEEWYVNQGHRLYLDRDLMPDEVIIKKVHNKAMHEDTRFAGTRELRRYACRIEAVS